LAAGASLRAATVTVFAAASLTDSLKQIAVDYEKNFRRQDCFQLRGSGTLARQIEAGAPADIFFSADERRPTSWRRKDCSQAARGKVCSATRSSSLPRRTPP